MHGEVPQFTRCCFCIPLRRGLIGWGYVRVAMDIINIINFIWSISWLYSQHHDMSELSFLLVMVVVIFIDCAFSVLLIVAGHMKSVKFMRVSYIYGIVWLSVVVALSTFVIVMGARFIIALSAFMPYDHLIMDLLVIVALIVIGISVQAYVVLLTRSEMIKLQSQSLEMQFTNHAADGEARCVRAEKMDDSGSTSVVDLSAPDLQV